MATEEGYAQLIEKTRDELAELVQEYRALWRQEQEAHGITGHEKDQAVKRLDGYQVDLERFSEQARAAQETAAMQRDKRLQADAARLAERESARQQLENLDATTRNLELDLRNVSARRTELAGMVRVLTDDERILKRLDELCDDYNGPFREFGT